MYKLNYFNFEEKNDNYLITNDVGEYEFLSKNNFKKLLQKKELDGNVEESLAQKGFIYKGNDEIFATKQAMKLRCAKDYLLVPTSLHIFVVSKNCNFNCIYCQAGNLSEKENFKMTCETAKKAVDIALQSPSNYLSFEFQGGEPLTNFETIKYIIEYSKDKKVQIVGPFMEFYDIEEKPKVYVMVHDLVREELDDERIKEDANNKYHQPFILNKELLGKWKIKEILPNIHFNPDKQKSNPSSTYMTLEFNDDGTTNFKNVKWSDNFLFIVTDNGVIANFMNIMKINDKEYLEIRMNDMSTIYYHAKPISYIYER